VGLNSRNIDNQLEQLTDWVDGLIDAYEGQKGIVHTANYRIAQHILRHSSNRDILIGHRPDNRMVAIRHFKSRKGSAVIVSPSLVRGEDFPGFHCRWQAIVKAPYPNIMDPQVKARMDMEPAWLDRVTMRSIIQAYGRGMRSEDDSCDTHGYDANIGKLFWRARSIVPGYVRSAIVQKGKEDAA
jgi:Rad3-related DNA helicase